jgi:hypothetical protein
MTQPAAGDWTYTNNPAASDLDELRFLIQDTDPDFRLLADNELNYLILRWMPRYDSLIYVGAIAAAVIARKFTGIVTVNADGVSVNTADLAQRYRDMATSLREEYKSIGSEASVDMANVMVGAYKDPSIMPLTFGMRLHDNPAAGQQDYGGWDWLYDYGFEVDPTVP